MSPQTTGGLTLINHAGGIAVNQLLSLGAGNLTLNADAGTGLAGAISDNGSGKLVASAGNLLLTANGGIGLLSPLHIGTVGGSLSATNISSGDLFLKTGSITLGSATSSLNEQAAGTLRVDANLTDAASAESIIIGGNISVGGATGTGKLELNTGTMGAISRSGAATLTAGSINLGANGKPVSIGAGAAPILMATSNLNAQSSSGDIWLSNTGNLVYSNVIATGGLVNLQNTGSLTTGTGNMTSSNNTVTVNASGLLTVTGATTIGLAGSTGVSVTGAGVTNNGAIIAGGGMVAVDAGMYTLSTTGVISNNASARSINLSADKMALTGGTVTGGLAATVAALLSGIAIQLFGGRR